MGWLTTHRDAPTLKAKAGQAVTNARVARGASVCDWCGKAISGRGVNYHGKCAIKAAQHFE